MNGRNLGGWQGGSARAIYEKFSWYERRHLPVLGLIPIAVAKAGFGLDAFASDNKKHGSAAAESVLVETLERLAYNQALPAGRTSRPKRSLRMMRAIMYQAASAQAISS